MSLKFVPTASEHSDEMLSHPGLQYGGQNDGRPMSKQNGTFPHHYEFKRWGNPKILGYLINMHIVLHVKKGKEPFFSVHSRANFHPNFR